MKGPDVNYNNLKKHKYKDSGNNIFYTCPKCRGEYLDSFIVNVEGEVMCIDCWNKRYGEG